MLFFDADLPSAIGAEWTLPADEAHHFARVRRGQVGESIGLIDGAGRRAAATVTHIDKRTVQARLESVEVQPRPGSLTVAVAPPKGDRFRWLVEKLTELGVDRVQPIVTDRSVTDPGHRKLDKLRSTSLAACKQCERAWLMTLADPVPLADAIAAAGNAVFIASLRTEGAMPVVDASPATVFIGPEGGWTEAEEQSLAHACPLRLGRHVLRTETAAIAAAVRLLT